MDTGIVIAIIVAVIGVLIIAAIGMWMYSQRKRSEELQSHFGPEYDRAIEEHGDQKRAESELAARRQHVEKLYIRPLSADERDRFAAEWRATQADFVDDPSGAITKADTLVSEVMKVKGYPITDFEARAADVSVDHPQVVENYRAAHAVAEASDDGEADTEDLRQGFVHYRALFDELLETSETKRTEAA
jgi:type II secretory pathway pseudopilin PulG